MTVTLITGDCRDELGAYAPGSLDACVTDPPYELTANKRGGSGDASLNVNSPAGRARIGTGGGFMGLSWDATGVSFDPATWEAVYRVLKPGAYLLAFGGTRTVHRIACAIEDAGFEIRDQLYWLHGNGFPKNHDFAGERVAGVRVVKPEFQDTPYAEGWGTALKPACEPIVVARKPFRGTVAGNVLAHGTGALNIDGCRVGYQGDADRASATPQGRATSKSSVAIGAEPDAGRKLERVEFERGELRGRYPANVLIDEAAADMLDAQTGRLTSGGTPPRRPADKVRNSYGAFAGQEAPAGIGRTSGGASRFFYCAKPSTAERNANGVLNSHPTVKPVDVMRWLVRLVTPPGGTVLDPFCGSGTTGLATEAEGFDSILIDLDPAHIDLTRRRISGQAPLLTLFSDPV